MYDVCVSPYAPTMHAPNLGARSPESKFPRPRHPFPALMAGVNTGPVPVHRALPTHTKFTPGPAPQGHRPPCPRSTGENLSGHHDIGNRPLCHEGNVDDVHDLPCPRATGKFQWSAEKQDHGNLHLHHDKEFARPVNRDIDHRVYGNRGISWSGEQLDHGICLCATKGKNCTTCSKGTSTTVSTRNGLNVQTDGGRKMLQNCSKLPPQRRHNRLCMITGTRAVGELRHVIDHGTCGGGFVEVVCLCVYVWSGGGGGGGGWGRLFVKFWMILIQVYL